MCRLLATLLVAVLALVGCSSNQDSAHNSQDVMFAQMMIPHHEGAVDMADLAATRASSDRVKALASSIKDAQGLEIATMTSWLNDWNETTSVHGMDHSMPGQMSADDMAKLGASSGDAFDKTFLTMMTAHHEGALEMARTELASGKFQPAKDLAASIISSQTAEIQQMKALLQG